MRLSMLPFSSSRPRAFCASMIVWASSASTGTKRTAVVNANANSYCIRDCSSASPRWSGDVVRKKTEKEPTSTTKRVVIINAYSILANVSVKSLMKHAVIMFMVKISPAIKAAPRSDLRHCFWTPASSTKGNCIKNSVMSGSIWPSTMALMNIVMT